MGQLSNRFLAVQTRSGKNDCSLDLPNECPLCHAKITPDHLYSCVAEVLFHNNDSSIINSVFACPSCHSLFYAYYLYENEGLSRGYKLHSFGPKTPMKTEFASEILEVSPMFVIIFNQAEAAEAYALDQIAGAGYRKALEFLIKDYASKNFPKEDEQIKAMLLAPCIEKFIEFRKLKDLAKVATWLGNDETHYLRKWESLDISDMKRFIRSCVSLIEADLTATEVVNIIDTRNK